METTQPVLQPPVSLAIDRVLPGMLLCVAVGLAGQGLQTLQAAVFGKAWLEGLVLAILLGAAIRTSLAPGAVWQAGIDFSGRYLLEGAVALMGSSLDPRLVLNSGVPLLAAIAAVVAISLAASYGLGRMLGLPKRLAVLIACGNAICGNSAIAAVAPVIGADSRHVTTAIAFTAVLGVAVVLGLPPAAARLHLTATAGGALAGMTVYAVPQVLAAAGPLGPAAVQMGTMAKLLRVLMLGPVALSLSWIARRAARTDLPVTPDHAQGALLQFMPWFIVGFFVMAAARAVGAIPAQALSTMSLAAAHLTVVAMAALGLGVDFRSVSRAGPRAIAAVVGSLAILALLSFCALRILGLIGVGPAS